MFWCLSLFVCFSVLSSFVFPNPIIALDEASAAPPPRLAGAFLTIDRPYPPLIDWLHHRIGTTHVAHHVAHTIPHYHAQEATECLKEAFPDLYLYDPTPIHKALYRIAKDCVAVRKVGDKYLFHKER